MTNKLYVSNLPESATEDSLRAHFAACGGVCDVQIGIDAKGRPSAGSGAVTMTSSTYALRARTQLDGAAFAGQLLRVSDTPISAHRSAPPAAVIAQQYRERGKMTYELNCQGTSLILRIFESDERWRVEARATDAADALVMRGDGATRFEAVGAALRDWNTDAVSSRKVPVDVDAVIEALRKVRAV